MSQHLVIRADAAERIGTGHIMRCLALAQAWRRRGGSAVFACAEITQALESRLAKEGFPCARISGTAATNEDAAKTTEVANSQNASWVVADSYSFGSAYQQAIKAAGLRLLLLDDYGHAEQYQADFVLNQNITADASMYLRRASQTQLLLGTRYTLLREEFLRWRGMVRNISPKVRKVLVTLGGSDPDNVTNKVIRVLVRFTQLETLIVIGGSNPHVQDLKTTVKTHGLKAHIVVDPPDMPQLMAWADVAIAAGGCTAVEAVFMNLPSMILVLADNQVASVRCLHSAGAISSLGSAAECSLETLTKEFSSFISDAVLRTTQADRGRSLVDGEGADRVATAIQEAT